MENQETQNTPTEQQQHQNDPMAALKGEMNRKFSKIVEENTALKGMLEAFVEKGEDGSYKLRSQQATPAPAKEKQPDVMQELNALKAELKKKDEALAAEKTKAASEAKRAAIVDALGKHGGVNPQRDARHIFDDVKQNSNGQWVIYSKDESGMDLETPLEIHVQSFLKANPELARANGKPGSGTPNGIGSSNVDPRSMSYAQYGQLLQKIKKGEVN